jgi:hypothetical protein
MSFGPATQVAPDNRHDAGETRDPAEHAVEEAGTRIEHDSAAANRRERRARETIEAVQDKKNADADLQLSNIRPIENRDAERDTECGPCDERPKPLPIQRVPQFPNRDALHDQTERDDQGRGLKRGEHMQPNRGGDQSERKAPEAGDERGGEGREEV